MSVKKVPSGRRSAPVRSAPVEVEVPGSTQSAVSRRSAEAQVRTLIDKMAPTHRRLINATRRSLRKPPAHRP